MSTRPLDERIFEPILTFFGNGKLQPTEEQLARRIDIPAGGLAIPTLSNITIPSTILGISVGGLILGGIILFLLFRKGK